MIVKSAFWKKLSSRLVVGALILLVFTWFQTSSDVLAKTRGIGVVVKPAKGQSRQIQLYDYTAALVIGIDRYVNLAPGEQLSYAVKDAKGMERVLRDYYQFNEIVTLYDEEATRDKIMAALYGFRSLSPDAGLLVYFAGHGVTMSGMVGGQDLGYLIPYDGSLDSSKMYKNISMQQVKADICPAISAKHIFFVFDACFAGLMLDTRAALSKPSRDLSYLQAITNEQVRQVLTAGSKGQTVLDGGPRGHSVFTGRLIVALENVQDYVTARELGQRLKKQVYGDAAARGHVQRPVDGEIYGTGDFVFVPNYEQRLKERLSAIQEGLRKAREKKDELSRSYERLLEEEKELQKKAQETKLAAQQREMERERAALEAKKRAYELEQARIEEEVRQKAESQAEVERQLQEQEKIKSTIDNLDQDIAKRRRELEAKKKIELAAIEKDKEAELSRTKELVEKIRKKRESLDTARLQSLTVFGAIQECKDIRVQMANVEEKFTIGILPDALQRVEIRFDEQYKRYTAEIEKCDKTLAEYERKINDIIQEYYANSPEKDMFETQSQFQQRLEKHKRQADQKAAKTREEFKKSLRNIKVQREEYVAIVAGLEAQHKKEMAELKDRILAEKEAELALYSKQVDDILNQRFVIPLSEIELLTYHPEEQTFFARACVDLYKKRELEFAMPISNDEARKVWRNRQFLRGTATAVVMGLYDVTIVSVEIIDDARSTRYSGELPLSRVTIHVQ